MRVAVLGRDLIMASRVMSAAARAGATVIRVDSPDELPAASSTDILMVDWAGRSPTWGSKLRAWRNASASTPRIVLFGPHTDVAAHDAARKDDLGPMLARRAFLAKLDRLLVRPIGHGKLGALSTRRNDRNDPDF